MLKREGRPALFGRQFLSFLFFSLLFFAELGEYVGGGAVRRENDGFEEDGETAREEGGGV